MSASPFSTLSTHNGPQPTNRLQNARGAGLLPPGDGDCSVVETALAKLIEQLTASNA
jgi:hypothetical protein